MNRKHRGTFWNVNLLDWLDFLEKIKKSIPWDVVEPKASWHHVLSGCTLMQLTDIWLLVWTECLWSFNRSLSFWFLLHNKLSLCEWKFASEKCFVVADRWLLCVYRMLLLLLASGYIGLRIIALEEQLKSLGTLTELSFPHGQWVHTDTERKITLREEERRKSAGGLMRKKQVAAAQTGFSVF